MKNYTSVAIVLFAVLLIQMSVQPAIAQTARKTRTVSPFTRQLRHLDSLAKIADPDERTRQLDKYWATLKASDQIPLVVGDSVAFLYRGGADSVWWQGDFNGWGRWAGGHIFNNRGQRVGSSNIWVMKAALPRNARLDYKIVLNGREWLPDPDNPHQQWGGGGPNSELRMPDWKPEPLTIRRNSVAKGTFSESQLMFSHQLGYDILYKVYVPAGYEHLDNLPTIYVTDGQEYVDERLGAMINVLDNLIADKKIKPIVAVFIDPREVKDPTNNRRMIELPLNDHFLEFVRDELVPEIDKSYRTNPSPDARAIMGTSLGGLNAAFFGLKASDTFRLIGIHSPAFWYRPKIYEMYDESPQLPLKIFMTTGVMSDTEEGARQMKSILERKNYTFQYLEVNEGHSWGNWRALIDDILVYFFQ